MSKHDKGNVVTKVLGLATVAVIGGAAVATLLPSADFSGTKSLTSADVFQSVESLVSPTPAVVTPTVVRPVKHAKVSSSVATSTATSTTISKKTSPAH